MSDSRPSDASHKLQMSYILNNGEDRVRHDATDLDPPATSSRRRPPPAAGLIGERKFVCPTCKFPFRSKGDKQKHIKTVHLGIKDHECPKCGARFAEKGNLTKHMKRHEGARVWKCSVAGCPKTFVLRDGLARHEKSVHGLQDAPSGSRLSTTAQRQASHVKDRPRK